MGAFMQQNQGFFDTPQSDADGFNLPKNTSD